MTERDYTVWSGEAAQVVRALDARAAVKAALDRWRWQGHHNVKISQVVVNATRELVDVDLWQ